MAENRVISFRDNNYSVDSKSRFADIVDKIPFDVDAFIKAMQDAILAENQSQASQKLKSKRNSLREIRLLPRLPPNIRSRLRLTKSTLTATKKSLPKSSLVSPMQQRKFSLPSSLR